jgi:hypothetical protein
MGNTNSLLALLVRRLPEQAERRRQQQQQQRQPKGQLPPDQQAELDNSLNTLGLALLRVWALACHVASTLALPQQQPAVAAVGAVIDQCEAAFLTMGVLRCHWKAAVYAELALRTWPPGNSTAASTAASSSSSSSDTVRYGKQVLPKLAPVSVEAALPAALATAHALAGCIDTMASYVALDDQQLLQQLQNATANGRTVCSELVNDFRQMLQEGSQNFANTSVLDLQLLLLAHQAKLQHATLRVTQRGFSVVSRIVPTILQLQQQQQQPTVGVLDKLMLPSCHERLLAAYDMSVVNIAALEQQQQQQQAVLPHIR